MIDSKKLLWEAGTYNKSMLFPEDTDLTESQRDILELPINDDFMIVGGPGTGKTVMAVYRAKRAVEESDYKPVLLLVYNNPLKEYISMALNMIDASNVDVSTYHQWIFDIYREYQFGSVPKVDDEFDWGKVTVAISRIGKRYSHIVVDEAQDFSEPLIKLLNLVSYNHTYFIDPNQSIEEGKTCVVDVIRKFFTSDKVKELNWNFRNTNEIRDLARLFCVKGEPPISIASGKKPVAVRCTPGDFDELNRTMLSYIKRYSGKNIGIITNSRMQTRIYDFLNENLSHTNVQMHKPQTAHRLNFSKPGVKIVSFGTMKGLDFDVVLIPLFDKIDSHHDEVIDNNRVYVSITRTHGDLYLFYWGDRISSKKIDTMSKLRANSHLLDWI